VDLGSVRDPTHLEAEMTDTADTSRDFLGTFTDAVSEVRAYVYEKKPRSVSQLKTYESCPLNYKLERLDKEWQRPAAWFPQGTVVHAVAEHYMLRELGYEDGGPMPREEAFELFRQAYEAEVDEVTDTTPNLDWWFRSGPYAGETDLERRY